GALVGAHHVDPGAVRPYLQLIDSGGTKCIRGADERLASLELELVGQLADGRGLAGAVDANDQHDPWRARVRAPGIPGTGAGRVLGIRQDPENLVLHEL